MKQISKQCISIIVALVMVLSLVITPIYANMNDKGAIAQNITLNEVEAYIESYEEILDSNIDIQKACQELFKSLSPEARALFLNCIKNEDKELFEFHNESVKSDKEMERLSREENLPSNIQQDRQGALSILNKELLALNLPTAVRYALMSLGGGIAAALGDGLLPIGDIIAAFAAVGAVGVLAYHWDTIEAKWPAIVNAFKKAFSQASANIEKAFAEIGVRVATFNVGNRISGGIVAKSATKHMEKSLVEKLKQGKKTQIYYSPTRKSVLALIDIPAGTKGDISEFLGYKFYFNYDEKNFNLTGFKLLLLYDAKVNQIFHAHIRYGRYAGQDIEFMRYENKMTWRVFPHPIRYEAKYSGNNPYKDSGFKPIQTMK